MFRAARVDSNQSEVTKALRKIGASVQLLQAEREACIRDCDSVDLVGADDCIAAIRARGQG